MKYFLCALLTFVVIGCDTPAEAQCGPFGCRVRGRMQARQYARQSARATYANAYQQSYGNGSHGGYSNAYYSAPRVIYQSSGSHGGYYAPAPQESRYQQTLPDYTQYSKPRATEVKATKAAECPNENCDCDPCTCGDDCDCGENLTMLPTPWMDRVVELPTPWVKRELLAELPVTWETESLDYLPQFDGELLAAK